MKNLYLAFIAIIISVGSISAQNSIVLNIDHQLGETDFAFDNVTPQSEYVFELSRLQYYISDIVVMHDGGSVTNIEDVWLLVNGGGTEEFSLGEFEIDAVESVRFYIGVGQDVNHDDPAEWPASHPLYPQNPSMHWGWASGYRFVAIEGYAGPSTPDNLFQIHALGDENYFEANVTVAAAEQGGTVTIPLNAEYANLLNGIDVSAGLINHSPNGASVPLLQNFSTEVFSAGVATGIESLDMETSVLIAPNPSDEQATLMINSRTGDEFLINIIDVEGRTVHTISASNNNSFIELPQMTSGLYIIEVNNDKEIIATERWVVK